MTLHSQYAYNRVMIRNDDSFIFNNIISNYGRKWMSNKSISITIRFIATIYISCSLIHESNASDAME